MKYFYRERAAAVMFHGINNDTLLAASTEALTSSSSAHLKASKHSISPVKHAEKQTYKQQPQASMHRGTWSLQWPQPLKTKT
jgi:hypothetical protein